AHFVRALAHAGQSKVPLAAAALQNAAIDADAIVFNPHSHAGAKIDNRDLDALCFGVAKSVEHPFGADPDDLILYCGSKLTGRSLDDDTKVDTGRRWRFAGKLAYRLRKVFDIGGPQVANAVAPFGEDFVGTRERLFDSLPRGEILGY